MTHELENPVVVEFPLRGEGWTAVTTPADRVPSHGTDLLGQRYAYDLLRTDGRRGLHVHPGGGLSGLIRGHRVSDAYAWGQPVHAPFDADVVRTVDGMPERQVVHPIREALLQIWNGLTFTPRRLPEILGNHVILGRGDVFAGLVHLAPGSVTVAEGQRVSQGDVLGRVGHSGNSTSPHLHFQLMDSPDPLTARGIPCAFHGYEVERDGGWLPVTGGVPRRGERLRRV